MATAKNYFVYECATGRGTNFEGTLKECFEHLRHAAGFGIANATTMRAVLIRGMAGFRCAARFKAINETRVEALNNSNKFFIL